MIRPRLVTVLLGGINALLIVAIASQWLQRSDRKDMLQSSAEVSADAPWQLDLPAADLDINALQAQSVFHKTRSFYVAPVAPSIVQSPPDYRFAGSMSLPNQPAMAVLVHNQTNVRTKVEIGDSLEQWTVTHIGPRHVIVSLGERTTEIGSTSPSRSAGMTVTSAAPGSPAQMQSKESAVGAVRILSAPTAGSASGASSTANASVSDAPRLYRPPSR